MMSSKRRAAVASLFVWLVFSPDVLLIAQASRPSGMMPSGIMEAREDKVEQKLLMSADLQFKVGVEGEGEAGVEGGYEDGAVELLWDENQRILSLVDRQTRPLWKSFVDTQPPPTITMSSAKLGIFIVKLKDHGTEVKLRARRVGRFRRRTTFTTDTDELTGSLTGPGLVGSVLYQSIPVLKKITMFDKSGLIPQEEEQDEYPSEENMALHLTSILQTEVSKHFGLNQCLLAGKCLQPCTAPQCVGGRCECHPRPFCNLQLTAGQHATCAPVIATDTYSPTPDLEETRYTDQNVPRALSVSNTTVSIEGNDVYLVRDESAVLATLAEAVRDLRRGVLEAESKIGAPQLEQWAELLPSATLLLSMVQNAHLIRRTLPWTHAGLLMNSENITTWVRNLQMKVQPGVSTVLKDECNVDVSFETNNISNIERLHEQLNMVESACRQTSPPFRGSASELQLVTGDSAQIEQKQRRQALAPFLATWTIILLTIVSTASFGASNYAYKHGYTYTGRFFLCVGGVTYVILGVQALALMQFLPGLASGSVFFSGPLAFGCMGLGPSLIGAGVAANWWNNPDVGLGPLVIFVGPIGAVFDAAK